jgi:heptosyltransferase I
MHVCLLRLSAIGDVAHAHAMINQLQKNQPHIQITWVIGSVEHALLKHMPGINWVIFNKADGLQGVYKLWQQLKRKRFDALLLMQVSLRANLLSLGIRAKRRIGFDAQRAKEGHSLFINERIAPQPRSHVLDGFGGFYEKLTGALWQPKNLDWDFHVPEAAVERAQALLAQVPSPFVICPAASKAERNWSAERYAALASHAHQQGLPVVICGGRSAEEQTLAKAIADQSQVPCLNLVGQTDLLTLTQILKQARLVLAPDTGPLHLAIAQGTRTIGLYAHSNPERTGPYRLREGVVSVYAQAIKATYHKEVDDLAWGQRVKGAHWMQAIAVETVIERFDALLKLDA